MILTLPDLITPEELVLIKQKLAAVPFADGKATVTEEPGWGVEIDPEWLARAGYQMSEAN